MVKVCVSCNKVKTLSDFNKNKTKSDGLQNTCKSCKKIYQKNYYVKYNKENRQKRNEYFQQRMKSDINFRLAHNLRSRLRVALKRQTSSKTTKTIDLLGCTLDFFKKYLESKFTKEMNWNNYGQWHIDHKIPLSKFKLKDKRQLKKACHYTNLQPLWAEDNLSKNNR